jgi:hypothetical protein
MASIQPFLSTSVRMTERVEHAMSRRFGFGLRLAIFENHDQEDYFTIALGNAAFLAGIQDLLADEEPDPTEYADAKALLNREWVPAVMGAPTLKIAHLMLAKKLNQMTEKGFNQLPHVIGEVMERYWTDLDGNIPLGADRRPVPGTGWAEYTVDDFLLNHNR